MCTDRHGKNNGHVTDSTANASVQRDKGGEFDLEKSDWNIRLEPQ